MPRSILFITTDQQRFDALGCTGGQVARTPVVDRLADEGLNYQRAHNQNVVCMPARSTMHTALLGKANFEPAFDLEDRISDRGWLDETDVLFTSDLGAAAIQPALIEEPVGHVDLASTFCEIAGLPIPDWNQGNPLPTKPGSDRRQVVARM